VVWAMPVSTYIFCVIQSFRAVKVEQVDFNCYKCDQHEYFMKKTKQVSSS